MYVYKRMMCLFIIVFGVVVLGGCTNKPETSIEIPVNTITASDGQATFTYVDLPEGVSAGDIAIRAMTEDELPREGDKTGWKGYDMSPDGIVFDTGAYLVVPYEVGMPFYFHEHDGVILPIDNVTYDIKDDVKIARVPLKGFSRAIELTTKNNLISMDLQVGSAEVEQYLPITATINLLKKVTQGDTEITIPKAMVQGTIGANLGVLDLPFVWKIPNRAEVDDTYTVDASKELKCMREGLAQIDYSILIRMPIERVLPFPSEATNQEDFWFTYKIHRTGECKEKPGPVRCGDNILNQASEQCDGRDFGGKTCLDNGFKGGFLSCEGCIVSTEHCTKLKERRNMSCSENSREDESGYDKQMHVCQNDCPKGQYCETASCTCHPTEQAAQRVTDDELAEEVNQIAKLITVKEIQKDGTEGKKEDGEKIEGIFYGGGQYFIPLDQIRPGQGPECDTKEHRHANSDEVTAWDGQEWIKLKDPFPDGCGFGLTDERPKVSIPYPHKGLDLSPYKPSLDLQLTPPESQKEEGAPMIQIDPPKTILRF